VIEESNLHTFPGWPPPKVPADPYPRWWRFIKRRQWHTRWDGKYLIEGVFQGDRDGFAVVTVRRGRDGKVYRGIDL